MGFRAALTGIVIRAWITWVNGATTGEGETSGTRTKVRKRGGRMLEASELRRKEADDGLTHPALNARGHQLLVHHAHLFLGAQNPPSKLRSMMIKCV